MSALGGGCTLRPIRDDRARRDRLHVTVTHRCYFLVIARAIGRDDGETPHMEHVLQLPITRWIMGVVNCRMVLTQEFRTFTFRQIP